MIDSGTKKEEEENKPDSKNCKERERGRHGRWKFTWLKNYCVSSENYGIEIAGHPLALTFMHKSHKKHPKMTTHCSILFINLHLNTKINWIVSIKRRSRRRSYAMACCCCNTFFKNISVGNLYVKIETQCSRRSQV